MGGGLKELSEKWKVDSMHNNQTKKEKSFCKVVAEIGSNHNGNWETVLEMLDHISKTKADAAKFQYYRADKLYPVDTTVAEYLVGKNGIDKNTRIVDLLKPAEIPEDWLNELSIQCDKREIDLIMSVFDIENINILAKQGIKQLKIASSEITHYPLLKAVGETAIPVILSTGMSNLGLIEKAIETVGHDKIILLHCTAAYPAPDSEMNLLVIQTLRNAFGLPVGLSDHSKSAIASIIAVTLGAVMIEKHFTVDRNLPGPDQTFSITPLELKELVRLIRQTEDLLGNPRKIITSSEQETTKYTPGIFAAYDIVEGDRINGKDIDIKRRNGEGISTIHMDIVIGKYAKVFISKGEPITWDKI